MNSNLPIDLDKVNELVEQGYIYARRHDVLPFTLYNYTTKTQFEAHWMPETEACRGLILADDGEVVARPFDKFFNWLEGGRTSRGHIVSVTEKIDGSLGVFYRTGGDYAIATRGSFDSEQAMWATEWLRTYYLPGIPERLTLLFEIVYPENRVVVDYGSTEALYLLAARDRFTGEYLPFYPDVYELAQQYGFLTPRVFSFNSVSDIIAATDSLPATSEGWVAEFSDGLRFKFKGDRYKELHRLVAGTTFGRVLEAVAGGTYGQLVADIPDEFLDSVKEWHAEIVGKVAVVNQAVEYAMAQAPGGSRKNFALWVNEHHKNLAPYLFLAYDSRDWEPLIFKREF